MKKFAIACVLAGLSSRAFAQNAPAPASPLATPTGHELSISVNSYSYAEPDAPGITIHGPKIGGGFSATGSLSKRRHTFVQAGLQASGGRVTYDGACAPWFITPNSTSPNGYELDLGDYSPCSETGDADWSVEGRALFGKDFIGAGWAWAPETGVGLRHLSNGTSGVARYRTDDYLYIPFGVTARTRMSSARVLSFNVEYDRLIHGWQRTRDSALGGGDVPPTSTAPGFTIDGFTDISFDQHTGWAVRASVDVPITKHWSAQPFFVHWEVGDSPTNDEIVTFTVNGVTAHETLGAYEPFNTTTEAGVRLGLRF